MPTPNHLPRKLFDAVFEMNSANTHADFISAVAAGLSRLIPADLCVVHVLDRKHQRLIDRTLPEDPYTEEEVAYYRANSEQNPLIEYYHRTGDNQARRISDVISQEAWLQSSHYIHCLSRLQFRYFLGLPLTVDADTVAGLSFNRRHRNFSKRDCELLNAFAPHFRLAWSRHQNPWHTAPQSNAPHPEHALTTRESEVLYWITQGKQNREIAIILGISLYTVQKHVANILRKLDVENRHALTVLILNEAADE